MISFTISFTPRFLSFVVNCTNQRNITMYEYIKMGFFITQKIPFENIVWIPRGTFTENNVVFYILTMLWHTLPAMLIDLILKFFGSKPM